MAKIKRITVSNLKAIAAQTADFNGCTAIITGANNAGKSSFLRTFPDRIRGIKPDVVLKHGETDGRAEIELTTGERLIWEFDGKKKEKLTFITEKNIPTSLTKEISNTYFPAVFDVDAFLSSGPKKQKETLQKISGIDFTELDQEYKGAYEARTWANKVVATEKAKMTFVDPKMAAEEIKVDALAQELAGIEAHNQRYQHVEEQWKAKQDQDEFYDSEIAGLEAKIKEIKDKQVTLLGEISRGKDWLEEPKNAPKTNAAELKDQIAKAEHTNREIRANSAAKAQEILYLRAVKDAEEADAEVKRLEALKADTLTHSSLPDGFGFDEDGITYNGFAFSREQLSSSAIYIAALKLAAIGLGEVKTLHFDASFLDKNSLADIEAWANANDLQLLIERPDFDAGEIKYELIMATPIAEGVLFEKAVA